MIINYLPITKHENLINRKSYYQIYLDSFKKYQLEKFYFAGEPDLELSTVLLINKAYEYGLYPKIISGINSLVQIENKNTFVKHSFKNATITSVDNVLTNEIIKSKWLTNLYLKKWNYSIPNFWNFTKASDAINEFSKFKNKRIIIKPCNENCGDGINSIDLKNNDEYNYKKFINIASETDSKKQFFIQDFATGIGYRFLVINYKLVAVLKLKPSFIIGDGVSTIQELINNLNKNPMRGKVNKKPIVSIKFNNKLYL